MQDPISGESKSTSGKVAYNSLKYVTTRSVDEKVFLEWSDLNYSVFTKDSVKSTFSKPIYTEKAILKNLNGWAKSGQLLAIMGPTGCGKTSLLNVLASRTPSAGAQLGSLTGHVKVNNKERDDAHFRRISAYVMQDDLLYPHLTVTETFQMAAHFYLPLTLSAETKAKVVEDITAELGLVKAKNTIIGNEKLRGVSGGERKRVAIATQLITDPAVLFLDEPTSGLDSFQAQSVMECLKSLASEGGRLVISVIHQPRSSIYNTFDQLLLLSEGNTMYFGEASKASIYFTKAGYANPHLFNPADFFLDILSPDTRSYEKDMDSKARIQNLSEYWLTSLEEKERRKSISEVFNVIQPIGTDGSIMKVLFNFKLLCWRSFTESRRDYQTIKVKFITSIMFSLIFGGIYSNSGNSQKAVQDRAGFLFIVCLNQSFGGMMAVLNTFPREKIIMNRERVGRAYDTTSYFLAKFITEIPLNVLPPFVFCLISYYLAGLNPAPDRFVIFFLIVMLEALTAISLGMAISALVPSVEAANAMGPPVLIINVLFGGYYINLSTIPVVANLLPYVSIIRWGFEAVSINEMRGRTFECDTYPCIST
eukprot:gene1000-1966_t